MNFEIVVDEDAEEINIIMEDSVKMTVCRADKGKLITYNFDCVEEPEVQHALYNFCKVLMDTYCV
jgi:hypothetical protein